MVVAGTIGVGRALKLFIVGFMALTTQPWYMESRKLINYMKSYTSKCATRELSGYHNTTNRKALRKYKHAFRKYFLEITVKQLIILFRF
jgi:hypothetical protein